MTQMQANRPHLIINDRFSVIRELGEGGFGKVYLVDDHETKEICALKLMKSDLAIMPGIQDKFKNEATIWMAFGKHPNIVTLRSVDVFNGYLFIVLEYVSPGETNENCLDSILDKYKISENRALALAIQLCDALIFANNKGMIAHRDLKPSNIMVSHDDSLKVTDFGLAIFSADPTNIAINLSPSGTPAYMPPEQFSKNSRIDPRSDIYSFGIILYQILAGGELPFKVGSFRENNYFDHFHRIHESYELPKLDSRLFPIMKRCLKKQIEERYTSFLEIRQDLEKLYQNTTGKDYALPTKEEMSASEHINFAVSYNMLGDKKSAMKHIDLALHISPGYPKALNNKAALLIAQGMSKDGIEISNRLIKSNPELGLPYYNVGSFLMQQGSFKEAVEFLRKAVLREPDYIPAIVNLAITYQKLRDAPNAIKYYELAIEFSPMNAQIHYNYGFLWYELSEFQRAEASLQNVLILNPNHLSALNYLGLCHLNQRNPGAAIEYFNQALSIDSNYRHAKENKALANKMLNEKRGIIGRFF